MEMSDCEVGELVQRTTEKFQDFYSKFNRGQNIEPAELRNFATAMNSQGISLIANTLTVPPEIAGFVVMCSRCQDSCVVKFFDTELELIEVSTPAQCQLNTGQQG
jgi:hypothetical protein